MYKKILVYILLFSILACGKAVYHGHSHGSDEHHSHHSNDETSPKDGAKVKLVTGQGDYVFSFDKALTETFPEDAKPFEKDMHGGFTEDPETGVVYTGIPGYGLCEIQSNLSVWKRIGDDKRLKDNIHGIVFFVHKGEKLIAVAQEFKRILIVRTNGDVVSEITQPKGNEFDFRPVNDYFKLKEIKFGVTDVTYLDGVIYVAHGYSPGDFVLTITEKNGQWKWGKLAWGGRGKAPGQFRTAHGIFAHNNKILVANRAGNQIVEFSKEGAYLGMFDQIPDKSLVCNISFKDEHFFFNALKPIGNQKSAPIYAHTGEVLVSTVVPGDLDIPVLTNIHHIWPHNIGDQLYLLIHGWNQGKYAVLKLESK